MSTTEDNTEATKLSEEICTAKKEDLEGQIREIVMEMLSNLQENLGKSKEEDSIEEVDKQLVPLEKPSESTLQLVKPNNPLRPTITFNKDTKDTPCVEDVAALATPQRKILVYPHREPSRHYIIHAYEGSRSSVLNAVMSRTDFTHNVMYFVTVKLVITFAITFACVYIKSMRDFMIERRSLVFCVVAIQMVSFIVLLCTDSARKATPSNCILPGIFTLCSSYICGYLTLKYSCASAMLVGTGVTVAVLLMVAVISWVNLLDFTTWYYAIDILLLSTLIFYLISSIFYWITGSLLLQFIFYCVFFVVMILSLLHQMELILGKRKHAMDVDESLLAGIIVYIETLAVYATLLFIIDGKKNIC